MSTGRAQSDRHSIAGDAAEASFRQLLVSPEFGEFARIVKDLTGLSLALNTPDVSMSHTGVPGDRGNPLCELIRKSPEGTRRCQACDRQQHALAAADGRAQLYECHAGFHDMAVPIMVRGTHIATLSSGQVLAQPPSEAAFAELRRRLQWLDVSTPSMQRAYRKAPWMPERHLRDVMRLIEIFAQQMCRSALRIWELEAALDCPAIRTARAAIEQRFRRSDLRLGDIAQRAAMSPAHFSHVFHRETGLTFTRYVQTRRVDEAKMLLARTSRSVTDICYACGFNSLTHFNRVFKRATGRSPRQWRHADRAAEQPGPGDRH